MDAVGSDHNIGLHAFAIVEGHHCRAIGLTEADAPMPGVQYAGGSPAVSAATRSGRYMPIDLIGPSRPAT
jgi:hypothetical protein